MLLDTLSRDAMPLAQTQRFVEFPFTRATQNARAAPWRALERVCWFSWACDAIGTLGHFSAARRSMSSCASLSAVSQNRPLVVEIKGFKTSHF
jgi:hypothetical protein